MPHPDLAEWQPTMDAVPIPIPLAGARCRHRGVTERSGQKGGVLRTPLRPIIRREACRSQGGTAKTPPPHSGRLRGGIGKVMPQNPHSSSSTRLSSQEPSSKLINAILHCPEGYKAYMKEEDVQKDYEKMVARRTGKREAIQMPSLLLPQRGSGLA